MAIHKLDVLVENEPGVLARVAGLFARRTYNIDSLVVGPTENSKISKMVIEVSVEGHSLEQVIAQLEMFFCFLSIKDVTGKVNEIHDTQPDYQN